MSSTATCKEKGHISRNCIKGRKMTASAKTQATSSPATVAAQRRTDISHTSHLKTVGSLPLTIHLIQVISIGGHECNQIREAQYRLYAPMCILSFWRALNVYTKLFSYTRDDHSFLFGGKHSSRFTHIEDDG